MLISMMIIDIRKEKLIKQIGLRIDSSRQGRFGGVAVTFSLCYCTKGTIFMPYMAKYLIKCPINLYNLYKFSRSKCFINIVEIENFVFSPIFFYNSQKC